MIVLGSHPRCADVTRYQQPYYLKYNNIDNIFQHNLDKLVMLLIAGLNEQNMREDGYMKKHGY